MWRSLTRSKVCLYRQIHIVCNARTRHSDGMLMRTLERRVGILWETQRSVGEFPQIQKTCKNETMLWIISVWSLGGNLEVRR